MDNRGIRPFVIAAIALAGVLAAAAVSAGTRQQPNYVELTSDLDFILVNSGDVIETIRDGLKMQSEKIKISFTAGGEYMDDIAELVDELMNRALEDTGDPEEGDYLLYQYGGYHCGYSHEATEDGYRYTITIEPEYYMNILQKEAVDGEIDRLLRQFGLAEDASDYEKFMTVYDYIYDNCAYDDVHKKNDYYTLKCTAYGTLINRRAVCQGFCVAMYRLLRELGVDCRIITGYAQYEEDTEVHSWMIVGIDGRYYNVDITWDIQDESHEFLLKCDDSFAAHIRDEAFLTDEFLQAYPMAEKDYDILSNP